MVNLPRETTLCPLPLRFSSFTTSYHPFSVPSISKSGVSQCSCGLFLLDVYADLPGESSGVIRFSDKYMQMLVGWMPRSSICLTQLVDWLGSTLHLMFAEYLSAFHHSMLGLLKYRNSWVLDTQYGILQNRKNKSEL